MKKISLLFVSLLISFGAFAQNSGLGFNYQAVVRNADGILLANSDVTLRISLYPGQTAASPTWIETHNAHTDFSGSFGITVGKGMRDGSSIAAKYADINFASVYYWMKIEIKEGSNYREVSFAQLPSSPYSEVAYSSSGVPAGMIVPFAGPAENIPSGWLLCDGAEVSRSAYPNLYKAIGVCWGEGDANTTFNLPDLRGMFLRGVSGESGRDADADTRTMLIADKGGNTGNNVGSYQNDAIRNITGSTHAVDNKKAIKEKTTGAFYVKDENIQGCGKGDNDNARLYFDASRSVGADHVGSDNRPQNVYVTYIIKY